jgi:type IV pilus assembly protein PilC
MADNMQCYQWNGINAQGKRVQGKLQAADSKEAQLELKKMGIEVIGVELKKQLQFSGFSTAANKGKIKPKDILLFTRYLSTMLSAGLPILQALDIIARDQENPAMQSLILTIRTNVMGGKTLAESFGNYPNHFNDLYINLVKAGEKSGMLNTILQRVSNYLEKTESLKRKIKKALVYPAAIVTIAIIVSLVLLIFVVPQFRTMFKSFGVDLPLFTLIVVHMSDFLRDYWWLLLASVALSVWGIKYSVRQSDYIPKLIDKWSLRIIIIGPILRKGIIARFTRTLATTLDAGMPIVECMKAMVPIMGNGIYSQAVLQICDEVVSGHQLSSSMAATKLFPNMAVQMTAVGEASGALSEMLNKVADYYEDDVNHAVDNLSSLLEPLIMALLGVIVGTFVVAMYLPIFKMGSLF